MKKNKRLVVAKSANWIFTVIEIAKTTVLKLGKTIQIQHFFEVSYAVC